jgi:hypothetical protein
MGAGTAATTTCSLKTAWAGAPFPENRVGGAPFPKTAWAGAPIPRNRAARHAVSHVVRSSALHLPRIYLDLKVAWRQHAPRQAPVRRPEAISSRALPTALALAAILGATTPRSLHSSSLRPHRLKERSAEPWRGSPSPSPARQAPAHGAHFQRAFRGAFRRSPAVVGVRGCIAGQWMKCAVRDGALLLPPLRRPLAGLMYTGVP